MSNVIAVTGPRQLTPIQHNRAFVTLLNTRNVAALHVGDAFGLDKMALDIWNGKNRRAKQLGTEQTEITIYHTEGKQPWQLQQRSKKMVDAIAKQGGTLHAFPNKSCPQGLTVTSWKGSGTWGTVRYAMAKGVAVELHWLTDEAGELPDWMGQKQLTLV
jgi:hypothetical protein